MDFFIFVTVSVFTFVATVVMYLLMKNRKLSSCLELAHDIRITVDDIGDGRHVAHKANVSVIFDTIKFTDDALFLVREGVIMACVYMSQEQLIETKEYVDSLKVIRWESI